MEIAVVSLDGLRETEYVNSSARLRWSVFREIDDPSSPFLDPKAGEQ